MDKVLPTDQFHIQEIKAKLDFLKWKGRRLLNRLTWDKTHLGLCLSEKELAAFETKHSVHLPEDYRQFLLEIGNGGLGPDYDFFALDIKHLLPHEECWWDYSPSGAFPLQAPLFLDKLPADRFSGDEDAHGRFVFILQGVIPLLGIGCGMHIWLVVNGAERGHLWQDDFASKIGIYPLPINAGAMEPEEPSSDMRQTFTEYYLEWLNQMISSIPGSMH